MPKPTEPTPEQLEWLENAVEEGNVTYRAMAKHIGVCVDTLKRILHRNDIIHFDGAKYQLYPETVMWNRPCMKCKDDTTRPKGLYFCNGCRHSDTGLPDEWNF